MSEDATSQALVPDPATASAEPVIEEPAPAANATAPAKPKKSRPQQAHAVRLLDKYYPGWPDSVRDKSTPGIRRELDNNKELVAENKAQGLKLPGINSFNRVLGRRPQS